MSNTEQTSDRNQAELDTRLTIVMPVYDDVDVIDETLRELEAFVGQSRFDVDVIVVDDGSTDGTKELVDKFAEERGWLSVLGLGRNQGKGGAVRAGALEAKGAYVLFSDSDLSTPLAELDKLVERLDDGFDVAIGSRALPDSRVVVHQKVFREYAGKSFNVIVRLFLLPDFRDTQCGFKCFRGPAARLIFTRQKTLGFEFDVELLCIARRLGLQVVEVPVIWKNHPNSHVRFVRDSGRMLLGLLKIWRRYPRWPTSRLRGQSSEGGEVSL